MNIITFEPKHLEEAAELLAQRHKQERVDCSFLPTVYEQSEMAYKAIKAISEKPLTEGIVAIENGNIIGYMLGTMLAEDYLGDKSQGWIYLPAHAAIDPKIYADMYAVISDNWVREGCLHHFTLVAANNHAVQDEWFSLSFGREQAHGALTFDMLLKKEIKLNDLTIRSPQAQDEAAFREMSNWISKYQTGTPIFAPVTLESMNAQTDSFVELLEDDEATMFLAFKDEKLVAYHLYYPIEADDSDMLHPENAAELVVAATHPEERGSGIGRLLTEYSFQHIKAIGYDYCVTDWRNTNILSARFWPKMGFTPTHYRLARRIDERINGIYKELWS